MIILVCGLPGVGKSSFCSTLDREHHYAHYDMERPQTWPRADLHRLWEANRAAFLNAVASAHAGKVALDWGFPPSCLPLVAELKAAGVAICWFYADESLAKRSFLTRSPGDGAKFEHQMQLIKNAGLPNGLGAIEVEVLGANGFRDQNEIWEIIFDRARKTE